MSSITTTMALIFSMVSCSVFAVSDGTEGASSTGSYDVQMLTDSTMRIFGISGDHIFASGSGDGDEVTTTACVFSNGLDVKVSLSSNFQLVDSAGSTMDYSVVIAGQGTTNGFIVSGSEGTTAESTRWSNFGGSDLATGALATLDFEAQHTDNSTCSTPNMRITTVLESPSAVFKAGLVNDVVNITISTN